MARIEDIQVGSRLREDMGDLAGLAESIKKYGLLHPIIVDEDLNLIAGQRRLEAAKLLGRADIDVKYIADLTDKEKQAVELEENLRRKDLTEYEKSKNLAELAKVVKQQAQEELCADSARNSGPGRPKQPGSYRDIEARTGIPEATVRLAEQHVRAVEQFPTLEDRPQKEAIRTAKEWNKEPEKAEQYTEAVEDFPGLKGLPVNMVIQAAENLRQMPPEVQQEKLRQSQEARAESQQQQRQIDEDFKLSKRIDSLVSSSLKMQGTATDEAVEAWLQFHKGYESIEFTISCLNDGIAELTTLRDKLSRLISGPRKVVRK